MSVQMETEIRGGGYLEENELVEENTLPHVGDGDAGHDNQSSEHKPFAPSFRNKTLGASVQPPVTEDFFRGVFGIVNSWAGEKSWRHDGDG
jgi:hypothetical protein